MSKVNRLTEQTIKISIVLLVIGLLSAGFLAYKDYKPVKGIMYAVNEKLSTDNAESPAVTDYSSLKKVLEKSIDESVSLKSQIPAIQTGFLTKLAKGEISDLAENQKMMNILNIRFDSDIFGMIIIHMEKAEEAFNGCMKSAVESIYGLATDMDFIREFMNMRMYAFPIEDNKESSEQGDDVANLVLGLQKDIFELGRNIVAEVLEGMDNHLRESGLRKQKWEIIRREPSSVLTSFGWANYSRTYFLSKETGERKFLVDSSVGIKPHDRVTADVVINAIEEAVESSYRKGGEKAAYVEGISKQAVMNKIHDLEIVQPSVAIEHKKELKILFVEADEDHVAQQKKKRETPKKPNQRDIFMPKMVYVHEGIDYEKSTKKRKALKNVRYFGGMLNSEDLWLEVSKYIDEVYDIDKVETIYLSGDGAAWIKQGLNWIPKSKFVLDNYHLNKYINAATAHLDNEAITQGLKDAVDEADKELLKRVFKKILELTDTDTKYNAVNDAKRYIENNWAGIEIKVDNHEIVGCSAKGHISHIFSDRLSRRPMGWSKVGTDKMAQLRIYKKNGGKIYDLVMEQRRKEKQSKDHEIQDKLIRELKKASSNRYLSTWNSNITILDKGHKTALYNSLRGKNGEANPLQ